MNKTNVMPFTSICDACTQILHRNEGSVPERQIGRDVCPLGEQTNRHLVTLTGKTNPGF